ncbi:class I mannose-6-phosphate isomerase [Aurantiacibacter poecillastricola]|uniref:class I mannose-6-phosphate isomerase n=1 Tax=Aurantiacibacter poecillastricola TaxID=3064385 RepID=UPI00273FC493|nr:class I mannose-6-phosphate isomerase [Aurantiacibacter sp. 219JJ12-13]MDP5260988.1 class I mannose-6-phosphate isomerase [Aurantiacibacter sp. 219JJ12-13]
MALMLLPIHHVEKVWGRDALPAPFVAPEGKRIGEIWFDPPPQMSQLLVKYLFTSEKLSVQCHPNSDQAEASGKGRRGKEECWLVVSAEPGAVLGIGFDRALDAETMRAAARDGSIEQLLTWHEVTVGDLFYIPANTVHAIGAGCSIIEIQQNSDITYRLYDYGRDRELHLDEGMAIADGSPYDLEANHRSVPPSGSATLVDGPHFRLDWVDGIPDEGLHYSYAAPLLVLPLAGEIVIGAEEVVKPGECALAPDLASVIFAPQGKALVTAPVG